ncbi:AAA family ATPase [Streptomyces tendae]|uniref:AAA family ATPase n=1 Tax=Streptomyces tendae TaxID=1932 RepID=UPI0036BB4E24
MLRVGVYLFSNRSHVPARGSPAAPLTACRTAPGGFTDSRGTHVTLVGRESVLHILDEALRRCVPGEARTVLVEGAAGCGKSELLDAFSERASEAGALALSAVGSTAERTLPLGVMRQLVACAGPWSLPAPEADDEPPRAAAMHAFSATLRGLTPTTPVVACVDDLHLADDASLRYLAHILRHARSAAFLLVGSTPLHDCGQHRDFRTELLRRGSITRVRLSRFTPEQTAAALTGPGQPDRSARLVTELHTYSGGNPLLLRALTEEYEWAASQAEAGPQPGSDASGSRFPAPDGLFVAAVETCLRRSRPGTYEVAQALAAVDSDITNQELAHLAGVSVPHVSRCLASMSAAGIVEHRRFRHPVVGATLLDRVDPADRARLHRRAAEVLHSAGKPSTVVADHLMAAWQEGAELPDHAWVSDVLREAAEHLVDEDVPQQAAALLELAHDITADLQQRAEIKTRLAAITWRFNPAKAEQHLSLPLDMLRAGELAVERLAPLATVLVRQGRVAEAREVREVRRREAGEAGEYTCAVLDAEDATPNEGIGWRPAGDSPDSEAVRCEQFLQHMTLQHVALQDATLLPLARAVRTLIYSEQPERATGWCHRWAEDAARHNSPTWRAVFATLHAEALLRLGDLSGAEQHALLALDHLPQRSGNAFAGSPTAFLVRARTAMGRHAAAATQLEQPVPETLFRSVHGLDYLYARGLHWLATGLLRAALADFLEVGRLTQEWGMDRPCFLAWRGSAAETLLRLGDQQRAEKLILEQLATPDAGRAWVHGTSLRLRAALQPSRQRLPLLHQAVDELRRSGDRVELARALADLGQALTETGDAARATAFSRQAWGLAESCGAQVLRDRIPPSARSEAGPAPAAALQEAASSDSEYRLSESERRVATLAARGYTNRQISRELYITVSTVEQHLTRVYRKLDITSRQDLPADLQLAAP